ncbi:hypothetical protein BV898_13160 [Hypsibius exemplaris]|uniref:G-protein coupled receptors family 1 profile domain-containing protein n=1 Tax=Hypsibius exemplaris TaxID=2072580 RepID=A0A1W0WBK0_HYPEX|nr:hypothetical protein BV898_13160 [Hypsibius exemplaris]
MNDSVTTKFNISVKLNETEQPSRLSTDGWFFFSILASGMGSGLIILLLIASFQLERLRKGSHILLIHLMCVDLILCGVTFPISNITTYMGMRGSPIDIRCNVFMFLHLSALYAENWTSLALAISRFVALTLPYHYQYVISKRVLTFMFIMPWAIGLASNLAVYLEIGGKFVQQTVPFRVCVVAADESFGYRFIGVTAGTYLPIALIGVIYLTLGVRRLVKYLKGRQVSPMAGAVPVVERPHLRTIKSRHIIMAKMLTVTFLWHCLCFLPPPTLQSGFPWLVARYPVLIQLWLFKTLALCGYVVSPFILLALSSDHRSGMRSLLRF